MSSQAATASTTKERLLTSGAHLFGHKGFGRVSVRDICSHANTSVSMINHHFGSKQGLLDAVIATLSASAFVVPMVLLKKEAISREDFRTRIEMLFETTLDAYIEHRSAVMVIVREQVPLPALVDYVKRLDSFLEDAKQKGFVRKELDSSIVGGYMFDRIVNQIQFAPWIEKTSGSTVFNDPHYKEQWCRSNLDLLLHGIAAP